MAKPICVGCRRFYRCEKNETQWEEGMPITPEGGMGLRPEPEDGEKAGAFAHRLREWESHWGPYKLWMSDMWKCPGCGHQILIGVPTKPLAEHFEPDYAEQVARADVLIRVNDC